MSAAIAWLTVLVMQPAPQDPWVALFEMSRQMGDLRLEMVKLRAEVEKLSLRQCSGASLSLPPPPPPAEPAGKAPSLPSDPSVPTKRQFGVISGQVDQPRGGRTSYVYLADIKELPVRGPIAEIKQKGMKFRPNHLVIRAGTRVSFPNEDSHHHHTFSLTPRDPFDLGYSRKDTPAPERTFAVPGVVDINCNIHQFMRAAVLVVPSHHYAKVASDGTFTLTGVPPGKHKLRAWTLGAKEIEREVMVEPDRTTVENLRLEAGPLSGSY